MKLKRIQLGHAAIPSVYAPAYPRKLSAEEFAALIAPRNRERALKLAATTCAALALSTAGAVAQRAPVAQEPPSDREPKVLGLLQKFAEAHPHSFWLSHSNMDRIPPIDASAGPVYVPRIPISFGNSSMGMFDAGAARLIAGEIFRAYGLEVETGVAIDTPGVQVKLDGADSARKLAFKLRGLASGGGMSDVAGDEPASTDLDAGERTALVRAGWKLHVADVNQYPLMDRDQVTPTLAYLAGIVEFLNSVTTGPDLDLRALLMGDRQHFAVASLEALGLGKAPPQEIGNGMTMAQFELKEARTIRLSFNSPDAPPPLVRERSTGQFGQPEEKPASILGLTTLGRICAIEVPVSVYDGPTPEEPVRTQLLQARAGAAEPLAIEARGAVMFTPSTFDSARPFELVVSLKPGNYMLKSSLVISVMRP